LAEEHGFESLWTVEHTVVPAGYASEYPYSADGKMPGGDAVSITDPLIWMSWVAAITTRLRVATGILILPQRNPITLAKQVATLDMLSGGRVDLGVGVGWLREEFDALGVPFEERGARTDEYIAALRALWSDDPVTFKGEFVSFERCHSNPKPVQKGGIPIVVGGHTNAAARRAGRLGDGFFPGRASDEELRPLIETMRASATDAGRDSDAIEITAGGVFDLDGVKRFADLGVGRIVIPPLGFDLETLKGTIGNFADSVIAKAG
ncbi:MAG: LLM class F420-dependent oxidoreductase, partial [Actinobacteria bacterium]|nr:LLM class F420-dependent oxidoreductase [Actinomycetota bacterium]